MRLFVLALALVVSAPGQTPEPRGAVSGIVLDETTRRPVRGARVALTIGERTGETVADFEGRFRFGNPPAGPAVLRAAKPGYSGASQRITIPAGEELSGFEALVRRHPVIAGRVVDHRNQPVVGAKVAVVQPWSLQGLPGYRTAQFGGAASSMPSTFTTDDRGEYRAWALQPGAYVVAVVPGKEPSAAGKARFRSPGRFYPGVDSAADAELVAVSWGDVREGVDLRLRAPVQTRAELRLNLEPETRPCPSCRVTLVLAQGNVLLPIANPAFGGSGGLVVEGLAPGRYAVSVQGYSREEGGNWLGLEYFDIEEDRPLALEVPLSGQVPVRGRLVLEDPPPGAFEDGKAWSGSVMMGWEEKYMRLIVQAGGNAAPVEIQGRETPFELLFFPMEGLLQLNRLPQVYIADITLNGRSLESNRIPVPIGGIPDGLEVRLRADPGRLQGVVDGAPEGERLYVHVAPVRGAGLFNPQRLPQPIQPDDAFTLALAPGVYDVFVAPAQAQRPPAAAQRVEIKPAETAKLTLSLFPD
jgi:hypothetical protein